MKKMIITILIILYFVLNTTSTVFAKPTSSLEISRITTSTEKEGSPYIYKNLIVYQKKSPSGWNIWGYDAHKKENFAIVEKSGHQQPVGIYEDWLLYNDDTLNPLEEGNVRLINVKSGEDRLIRDGPGYQMGGAIWGDHLAYIDGYHCGRLYVYSIAQNKSYDTTKTACRSIRMWGNTIVWSRNSKAYGYTIKKGEQFELSSTGTQQLGPKIYGNNVVWLDKIEPLHYEVHEKNLKTGAESIIYETTTTALETPVFSDKYVAWVEKDFVNNPDITFINRKTRELFKLSTFDPSQVVGRWINIYKNFAVWESTHEGSGDIYKATL